MTKKKQISVFSYFIKNINIIVGIVLIWRGIWHVLDGIDVHVFNGNPFWTTIGGIILGFLMIYLPDHDLKEIEKLWLTSV